MLIHYGAPLEFTGALISLLAPEPHTSSDSEDEEVVDLGSKTSEIELDDESLDNSGSLVHIL